MTTTTVSFRTDIETKKQADKLFDELGISMSSAINMFLKQTIRSRALPFRPTTDWVEEVEFSDELIAAIDEAEAIEREEIEAETYHNMEELMKALGKNTKAGVPHHHSHSDLIKK